MQPIVIVGMVALCATIANADQSSNISPFQQYLAQFSSTFPNKAVTLADRLTYFSFIIIVVKNCLTSLI
jgi:hypothetical protein